MPHRDRARGGAGCDGARVGGARRARAGARVARARGARHDRGRPRHHADRAPRARRVAQRTRAPGARRLPRPALRGRGGGPWRSRDARRGRGVGHPLPAHEQPVRVPARAALPLSRCRGQHLPRHRLVPARPGPRHRRRCAARQAAARRPVAGTSRRVRRGGDARRRSRAAQARPRPHRPGRERRPRRLRPRRRAPRPGRRPAAHARAQRHGARRPLQHGRRARRHARRRHTRGRCRGVAPRGPGHLREVASRLSGARLPGGGGGGRLGGRRRSAGDVPDQPAGSS